MGLMIENTPIFAKRPNPETVPECDVEQFSLRFLEPILTVIIPIFNEAKTIDELLRRVMASSYSKQVIVVNDGSTDGTKKILESWHENPGVEFVEHPVNRGKGAAIRTGLATLGGGL